MSEIYRPVPQHEGVDTEEQLVIGSERDFIELQEPQTVHDLGSFALQRAHEYMSIFYECQEALNEWGYADKRRGQRVDLLAKASLLERARVHEGD
ncbi:hypothetical protein QM806_04625 [Rhodococcus sp. IEGM 1351]|uniref:hypothetical protein n=1 Tax=Rhodococcus sp. IEGM 1351 TaxID=3047089 RepID=UPI0024B6F057|nr:hypothetical protein [Rhodococcus sp. IEGM 1351]MDI9934740.1 hypothetical protein [Rhodococcus sp. IEGM 1351]